jgi:hypothetical protein
MCAVTPTAHTGRVSACFRRRFLGARSFLPTRASTVRDVDIIIQFQEVYIGLKLAAPVVSALLYLIFSRGRRDR